MNEVEKRAFCSVQCATCAKRPKHRGELCCWYTGEVCEAWTDFNDSESSEEHIDTECPDGIGCSECGRRDECPNANPY